MALIDLAGHQRYAKTAMLGLIGQLPDYAMLVLDARVGLQRMGREHLSIALALGLPLVVVLNKSDGEDAPCGGAGLPRPTARTRPPRRRGRGERASSAPARSGDAHRPPPDGGPAARTLRQLRRMLEQTGGLGPLAVPSLAVPSLAVPARGRVKSAGPQSGGGRFVSPSPPRADAGGDGSSSGSAGDGSSSASAGSGSSSGSAGDGSSSDSDGTAAASMCAAMFADPDARGPRRRGPGGEGGPGPRASSGSSPAWPRPRRRPRP